MSKKSKNKVKEPIVETMLEDITEETLAELSNNEGGDE